MNSSLRRIEMTRRVNVFMSTVIVMALCSLAQASEDHTLVESCKAECPTAKTEHEAHKCMDAVAKKKAADKSFKKSECFHAYQEHEKAEKKHGHKH